MQKNCLIRTDTMQRVGTYAGLPEVGQAITSFLTK